MLLEVVDERIPHQELGADLLTGRQPRRPAERGSVQLALTYQ